MDRKEQNRRYYLARKARLSGVPVESKRNLENEFVQLATKLQQLQQEFQELHSQVAADKAKESSTNVIKTLTK